MDEARLRRIEAQLARLEIIETMWRYTRAVDRHDNELLARCFWPDCEISYTNIFSGDLKAFLDWANAHHDELYINHQHHVTSHIIDIDGDTAHAEHFYIAFLQRKDGSVLLSSGRYLQQWECRDDRWAILIREFMPEISTNLVGGTARLTTTAESLLQAYAQFGKEVTSGSWAPFPPSGPSRQDQADLGYRRPLGRRADRG